MTLPDIIVIAAIVLVIGGAVAYIIKAKKSGRKCIGCPAGGCSACSCCSNDTNANDNLRPIRQRPVAILIETIHRVIGTICKEIKTSKTFFSTQIRNVITIDEPTHRRIVISALEIVERGFGIAYISASLYLL